MKNKEKQTIYIVEDNLALKDLYKRFILKIDKSEIIFIEFDDITRISNKIIAKKEKIIVDISRCSNYILQIATLKKIFFDHSRLLVLLVNESQSIDLKKNNFLSERILIPQDFEQIKIMLEL